MKRHIYNVAIFGAGRIGNVHAGNILNHPKTDIKYVADPNQNAAKELAKKVGAEVADNETILNDGEVDAIVICSATDTHANLVEQGLNANKNVFCEKPLDLSVERARELVESTKDATAPLFVAFNRRFDPGIVETKKRIDEGVIGEVELVTIISKDPEPPPASYMKVAGGMLRDMTIHDFDLARFLLGENPNKVSAMAAALFNEDAKREGDFDTVVVTLQTKTGKIATISNSRRTTFGYDQRVEVHGSNGQLRTDNRTPTALIQQNESGTVTDNPLYFFLERYQESYNNEWTHFVEVIESKKQPLCTGEDGVRALKLAEAAYKAIQTKTVVEVDNS